MSVLAGKGIEVALLDLYSFPMEDLLYNPTKLLSMLDGVDFVGLYTNTICLRGVRALLNHFTWLQLSGKWAGKVICGGPHASVRPESLFPGADYVVVGEGEHAIVEIVEGRATPGVVQAQRITDLDALPPQPWHLFINQPYRWTVDWIKGGPIFTMNTSRGCPYACAFCSVQSVWGNQYTAMSAERIVEDIDYLVKQYGAKGIYFREDNFFTQHKRVARFCELLNQRQLNIQWAAEARADNVLKCQDIMSDCVKSGLAAVYMGIESGCQHILSDTLLKGLKLAEIGESVGLLHQHGVQVAGSFMVGLPGETKAQIQQTIDFANSLNLATVWWNVFVGIPESPLYKKILADEYPGWLTYEDDRGLLYGSEHNQLCDTFYKGQWDAKIPVGSNGPIISVVIPTYNDAISLPKAVDSIWNQTFQDLEIILVDDGSTDNTPEVAKTLHDTAIRRGRILRYTRSETNRGLSHARNTGNAIAAGKYIACQDSDDISFPCRLERMYEFLEANPDYVMVGSGYYSQLPQAKPEIIEVPLTDAEIRFALPHNNPFCHGSTLMRRDVVVDLRYDETIGAAVDYELWSRMITRGKVANLPFPPEYVWTPHAQSLSIVKKDIQTQVADMVRERLRNVPSLFPLVSVIIPTYNRPKLLERSVRSVLAQRYQNFEILVVNDGGIDIDHIATLDDRIRVIGHDNNLGLASARNSGIRNAQGNYVAFLDDDDYFYRMHLSTHMAHITQGHRFTYSDAMYAIEELDGETYREKDQQLKFSENFDRWLLLVHNLFPVNTAVVDRALFETVGLFDPAFSAHEDWDLWIRMADEVELHHIKLITCVVSYREDTMTNTRKRDFYDTMLKIHEKYKQHYGHNKDLVKMIKDRQAFEFKFLNVEANR
jgi:glycosyltransferase involved in cell wall biosynthesis/tRNA A37 methylthiotransferase MiaB